MGSGSERRNESAELQLHNKMVRVGLLQSFFGAIVILALWFSALWYYLGAIVKRTDPLGRIRKAES